MLVNIVYTRIRVRIHDYMPKNYMNRCLVLEKDKYLNPTFPKPKMRPTHKKEVVFSS